METAGDTCVIDNILIASEWFIKIAKHVAKCSKFMALSVISCKPQRDESMCWVTLSFS